MQAETNPFSCMKNGIALLSNHRTYFTGFGSAFLLAGVFLMLNGKAGSFISLNHYHPFLLNVFFINYTFMGDGIFAICLIAAYAFYFRQKKKSLALLFAFLGSGLMVQVIKNLVSAPRPRLFFEPGRYLHFVDGVSLSGYSSFPSGHTATAFAVATVLVLFMKNTNRQIGILGMALLVGYSRIYLAQHFIIDIMIGALIGVIGGVAGFMLATLRFNRLRFRGFSNSSRQGNYWALR